VLVSTPEQLTIDTPEQIALEFSLASVGSRFLALGIDTSFQVLGFVFLAVFAQIATIGSSLSLAVLQPWVFALLLFAGFLIYYGYFAMFEIWWGGQTPGKRIIGLRVISVSGRPITAFEAILRNLVRIADQLPGMYAIGIVSVFVSAKHQRLGDFAAGTVVVHERPLESQAAPETPAVRLRHGAAALAADEILVVDAFLRRRDDLTLERRGRAATAIASRIRSRLNVTASEPDDEAFLEDIVAEYRSTSGYR
jgi:uncharacterized RDD family membrane protein YckC